MRFGTAAGSLVRRNVSSGSDDTEPASRFTHAHTVGTVSAVSGLLEVLTKPPMSAPGNGAIGGSGKIAPGLASEEEAHAAVLLRTSCGR
jgi:hypothetical protein